MIKAVIFDMDGLLIDSEPLWQKAQIKTFTEIGVILTKEDTAQTIALRVDEVVDYWYMRKPWKIPTKKEVEARIVGRVTDLIGAEGKALRGVDRIVNFFSSSGLPMAIASSSSSEVITAVLEKVGIASKISVIHSAEHEPYGKPHPGVFITTAEKLKVLPEHCLVFEDSPNGVLAAKAAKMKCIAVPNPYVINPTVFSIADKVIDSLEDFELEDLQYLIKH